MNLFNKSKCYLFFIGYIIVFNFLISLIYYFSNIGSKVSNLLLFIFTLFGFIVLGLYLGYTSNETNRKRGLINSIIICMIMFVISLFYGSFFSLGKLLYYIILIFSCTTASIIGIKIKKR